MTKSDINVSLKELARAIGSMPVSSGFLLAIGIVLFVIAGHESGIVESSIYRVFNFVLMIVALYAFIVKVCAIISPSADFDDRVGVSANATLIKHEEASKSDIQQRANHEAGHIIALAYLPKTPDELNAWISTFKHAGIGGRVAYNYREGIEVTEEYLKAVRLFAITPIKVEELMLGKVRLGSDKDIEKWEQAAKQQLNSFPHNMPWFRSISSEFEAKINERTLNALLEDDLRSASKLVEVNEELIVDISTALILSKNLCSDTVSDFVGQVVLP